MNQLNKIKLEGFKSIRSLDLELSQLNVMIGANGAGKSNLVSFFRMLHFMMSGGFQEYIIKAYGADNILHYGSKHTSNVQATLEFNTDTGTSEYKFKLAAAATDKLVFTDEQVKFTRTGHAGEPYMENLEFGQKESVLSDRCRNLSDTAKVIRIILNRCRCYQFHDTSDTANMRGTNRVTDNRYLRSDGGNLAAFLYMLRKTKPDYYRRIVAIIRLAAPHFHDFELEPERLNPDSIMLNWKDKFQDFLFGPQHISDGLLRFMALTTLLKQPPDDLPDVIVIDEPELGLHPFAMNLLGGMLQEVAHEKQIIIATQSINLLDQFEPEDVIVAEMHNGESSFHRLPAGDLKEWLDRYESLGELWEKNVFGGRPAS